MRRSVLLASTFTAALVALPTAHALPGVAQNAVGDSLRDLPLSEVRSAGQGRRLLAILLTGDGGWAAIDKKLSKTLADSGISVVGLDSRHYFKTERTPEVAARDLERIIRSYGSAWEADRYVIIGYSHGADVAPFMVARLPADLRSKVELVALFGAAHNANFKFHLLDMVANVKRKDDFATLPEIGKLSGTPLLCVYGSKEGDSVCHDLTPSAATVIELSGGHHLDGDYAGLADTVIAHLH